MTREEARNTEERIYKILTDNKIYPKYIEQFKSLPVFMVTIDGDWKHDHGYARYLLEENGFSYVKEESLPSWDDWYTATHYYIARDEQGGIMA